MKEVLRGAMAMAGGLLKEAHPVVNPPSRPNCYQVIRWKEFGLGLLTKIGRLWAKLLIMLEPT